MMKKRALIVLAVFMFASLAVAQLPDETNGKVPELDAFHKPIYELWHTAWPSKDIATLKKLLPDVDKAYTSLAAAKLPGILREKKGKWDEKLQILAQSMKEYRNAVQKDDNAGILKATEAVHMNYEQMVRLVRPALKELDAFHQSLYMLHHYYMPEHKTTEIASSADSLSLKMAALNGASLPKRLEAKSDQFAKARKNLADAVQSFVNGVNGKKGNEDLVRLESAVHARYEVLEKIFD